MATDELIQAMRTTRMSLVRTRLMLLEDQCPDAFKAIEELFAPEPENKRRWNPVVAKNLHELREKLRMS